MQHITLTVVSQERELLREQVVSVTAPTTDGEITILPHHIPLITTLETGEVVYRTSLAEDSLVISNGFLTVSEDNQVIIMVDSAVHAREISLKAAQKAVEAARSVLVVSNDQREMILAEASLKRALLELRVAERAGRRG